MKNILIILLAFSLFSCSSSKILQKSLQKPVATIGYVHDSKMKDCDRSKKLNLLITDRNAVDTLTTVEKQKGKALPFLFFNYFEKNMQVQLGQNSYNKPYAKFLADEFEAEAMRTGNFTVTDKAADYTLEISIDTCEVKSRYQMSTSVLFLVVAYSYSIFESGFPAIVTLDMNVKLKRNNVEIYSKNYHAGREQPFITKRTQRLYVDFISNMTEGLALSSKEIIEKVIEDANVAISEDIALR